MMKRLRFESLELLSFREQKARKIEFHPRLTVIQGENDVGKSSVIKSLYWTFGASPAITHPKWSGASIKAFVSFTVDDARYHILRDHDAIAIFDGFGKLILVTSQITTELAPLLGNLLNFKLVLTNRKGEPEVPPPAYAFLPFYIDQDSGWRKPLDSFANLTQYTDFRTDLLEFHTGILPNEYYELEAGKRRLIIEQRVLEADRRAVEKALEQLKLETSFDGLELSIDGHEQAIEGMLNRIQSVRIIRQERAQQLADVLDQRIAINQQMQVVKAAIIELAKDATYAGDLPENVFCPTCGTNHKNDFANRYSIVEDREACFEFYAEAREKVISLTRKALKAETEVRSADRTLNEIQTLLETKKGEISLLEVVESRGRRIAADLFGNQIGELIRQVGELLGQIKQITDDLKKLKDSDRRDKIVNYYTVNVLNNLRILDVTNFSVDEISQIPARIRETGSDLPRAILAHALAILKTINEFSSSVFAPIVIDSPNQQDQDAANVGKMIDLIISSRPYDAQIILGTVSLHGRKIDDGRIIEFDEKLSVLRARDFRNVAAGMQPYLQQMIDR